MTQLDSDSATEDSETVMITGTFQVGQGGSSILTNNLAGVGGARSQLDALDDLANGKTFDCSRMTGGYSDLGVGTQVRAYDAAGNLLAAAPLEGGLLDFSGCHFTFEMTLPVTDTYDFEISQRGRIAYTHAELERGGFEVSFSLG